MKKVLSFILAVAFALTFIDFARFPECYLTTAKYQLRLDINRGRRSSDKILSREIHSK
ncbi:MAG: hypothetical protein IJZ63_04230 [Clostridia bacterium]|nr:hypothetical protein [Clostridia bacterium]